MTGPSIAQLEQALFDQIPEGRRWKVAMVIAMATENFAGFWDGEPTFVRAKIEEALTRLVGRDDVLTFGNVNEWRHSELSRR